jgi:hypothetical protein
MPLICCLGSHTLKCPVGVFIASPTIIAVRQKQELSVDGRTVQSAALATSATVGSVAVDRWIRQLPRLSGAAARSGPLYVGQSGAHWTCMLLFTVQCTTSALAGCPLHGFLR